MIDDEKQIRELISTLSTLVHANPPYDKEAIQKALNDTDEIDWSWIDERLMDKHYTLSERATNILNDKPVSNWQFK